MAARSPARSFSQTQGTPANDVGRTFRYKGEALVPVGTVAMPVTPLAAGTVVRGDRLGGLSTNTTSGRAT